MKTLTAADYEGAYGHVQWGSGGEREAVSAETGANGYTDLEEMRSERSLIR